ncbi:MAG: N-acetylmuramoyl-L-alanine amidase [Acetobacter sp.]|nr:N-acetylmuramoyl-L-alanine amidase [Bacteroides sp.]MCM1340566.1 N-acetylmuramoyl-L-alanine amidase [Acetobacter sp.]MCM1433306.1 N-acetylmuramoyl-L-alanine amidase [Clostridiales bacterium]
MNKSLIITLTMILTVCTCSAFSLLYNKSVTANNDSLTNQHTLVIDAGHGGRDCGTVGIDGALEKEINLAIALDLYDFAKICGYNTQLTRSGDYLVYSDNDDRSRSDLYNRFDYVNSFQDSTLISIHQNHFENEKEWGMQVWYSPNDDISKNLADSILKFTKNHIQSDNKRENKKSDSSYYLLHKAKVPSVMVECGFMSNAVENSNLQKEEYQKNIAYSIFMGYNDYNNTGEIKNG